MAEALRVSGFKTKKETVEEALKLLLILRKSGQHQELPRKTALGRRLEQNEKRYMIVADIKVTDFCRNTGISAGLRKRAAV